MDKRTILCDWLTSILIDYYRKTDKENAVWIKLIREQHSFAISAVTKYEIFAGAVPVQMDFWNSILPAIAVLAFDDASVDVAVAINSSLKKKRKQIALADLFIAATAINNGLPLAILNRKHFERIDALKVVALGREI